jgi:hypothetical protein
MTFSISSKSLLSFNLFNLRVEEIAFLFVREMFKDNWEGVVKCKKWGTCNVGENQ